MMDLVPRPPAMGVATNPLMSLSAADMQVVPPGASVYLLRPKAKGTLRCYLNGESLFPITARQIGHHARLVKAGRDEDARVYLRRAVAQALNWKRTILQNGDTLAWHEVTQDKDVLQILIVVAAIVYVAYGGDPYTAFRFAAYALAAVNILIPPSVAQQQQQAGADPIFNTNLNGNTARLDQPIWKNCGLTKLTPPFAGQPYYEYRDTDGDNLNNDQYYYAVFAVGEGDHDLLAAFIGKTPIGHYQDVVQNNYLHSGFRPIEAQVNVVTSSEVSQLELNSGKYVGGYLASQPKRKARLIGIDVMCPQGLGKDGALTVAWRVYSREIDDFGRPVTAWALLASETRTANTNTPQRWSNRYQLANPARVEIQLVRTDVKDLSSGARHSLQWIGLRAYLNDTATLNPNVAHYEVVMRASEQLSGASQRDFSLIVQAKVRTWQPGSPGWGPAVATRNPAWWLADLWTNPIWGEGLPDDRIDLQGLYDFALECDARQDRFDHTFTSAMTAWDAAQLIARAGRARCFRRFGINTLMRDKLLTLPVTAFTHRNTVPNSMVMSEKLPGRDFADGYVIEFTSNVTWDIVTIECPCPGYSVSDPADPRFNVALPPMARPIYMRLEGIKGATHAEREGLYEAAVLLLRTRICKCKTEMQGVIPAYGDPVRWMPEIAGYGQSGDVVLWTLATLVMRLTEPADFSGGATYLKLIRDDGSLTVPVRVLPGPSEYDIVLPAAPDFALVLDDGTRERPKFLLGTLADADELVKVAAITDGGKSQAEDGMPGAQLYDIAAVVDDARVHSADALLLPGPGDVQDPVFLPNGDGGGGGGGGGGGDLVIVSLSDYWVDATNYAAVDASATFTLANTGLTSASTTGPLASVNYIDEWMTFGAVETAVAALYEVRFTYIGGLGGGHDRGVGYPAGNDFNYAHGTASIPTGGDTLGIWLNLGTSRILSLSLLASAAPVFAKFSVVLMEIREVASQAVQATRTLTLHCQTLSSGNGV